MAIASKHEDKPLPGAHTPREGISKPGEIAPFQPAPESYPQPEDPPNTPPWEKGEFKKKVLEAGFPGSPGSDTGFLAALYKFTGGKIEEDKPASSPSEHKK